jgi:hypothetical protein
MSLTKNIVKGRTYLTVDKVINKRKKRLEEEKQYLINVYNLEQELVNNVIENLKGNKQLDLVSVNEENYYIPDYNYEKEMLDCFEEFKTELVYDGMSDLANSIKYHHFMYLFSPYYNPCF